MQQNHVIDPTFFEEVIAEFGFDYDWYVVSDIKQDELYRTVMTFDKRTIFGSLQPQNASLNQKIAGNTTELKYMFYCSAMYRINQGDFIHYKERWLHVDGVQDYDEYGVRQCSLTMVNLSDYKDLEEYIAYLDGDKVI